MPTDMKKSMNLDASKPSNNYSLLWILPKFQMT